MTLDFGAPPVGIQVDWDGECGELQLRWRFSEVCMTLLFTLVWNGILVAVLASGVSVMKCLILSPFLLFGALMCGVTVYTFRGCRRWRVDRRTGRLEFFSGIGFCGRRRAFDITGIRAFAVEKLVMRGTPGMGEMWSYGLYICFQDGQQKLCSESKAGRLEFVARFLNRALGLVPPEEKPETAVTAWWKRKRLPSRLPRRIRIFNLESGRVLHYRIWYHGMNFVAITGILWSVAIAYMAIATLSGAVDAQAPWLLIPGGVIGAVWLTVVLWCSLYRCELRFDGDTLEVFKGIGRWGVRRLFDCGGIRDVLLEYGWRVNQQEIDTVLLETTEGKISLCSSTQQERMICVALFLHRDLRRREKRRASP